MRPTEGRRVTKPSAEAVDRHDPHARDGRASRRRTRAIRGRRWRSRRSPTCSTGTCCGTTRSNPEWPDRDRFVLSAGHACILQYASLHLSGYNLSLEELKRFRQWESRTPGHPEHFLTEGVETTTGAARPGVRERRRHGDRRALPRRALQPAHGTSHRPPHLRDLLRRRPDGGRHEGGRVDRRPPRPRQARLRLRRQPHHDRRHDLALVHDRGQGRALRGVRLARPARRRLGGRRRARAGARARRRPRRSGPRSIVVRSHIALSARRRRSTPPSRTARRSARTRCAATKEALGWDPDAAVRRAGRGAASTWTAIRERGPSCEQEWQTASSAGRRRSRACARSGTPTARGKPRPGW